METDHRQRATEPEDTLRLRGGKDTVCVCVFVNQTNREVCVSVYQYVVIEAHVCVDVRAQSNIMAHLTPS